MEKTGGKSKGKEGRPDPLPRIAPNDRFTSDRYATGSRKVKRARLPGIYGFHSGFTAGRSKETCVLRPEDKAPFIAGISVSG